MHFSVSELGHRHILLRTKLLRTRLLRIRRAYRTQIDLAVLAVANFERGLRPPVSCFNPHGIAALREQQLRFGDGRVPKGASLAISDFPKNIAWNGRSPSWEFEANFSRIEFHDRARGLSGLKHDLLRGGEQLVTCWQCGRSRAI